MIVSILTKHEIIAGDVPTSTAAASVAVTIVDGLPDKAVVATFFEDCIDARYLIVRCFQLL